MAAQAAPRPALAISNDVVVEGGAAPLLPVGHAVLVKASRHRRRPLAPKVNDAAYGLVSRVGLSRPSTDPNVDSRTWHNAVVVRLATYDAHAEMAAQAYMVISKVDGLYAVGAAARAEPMGSAHANKSVGPARRQIAAIRPSSLRGALRKSVARLSN